MPKLPSLPRIRKPRGMRKPRSAPRFKAPAPPREEAVTADMDAKTKRAYYALCGEPDERVRLANAFARLLITYPVMTFPEAITYELLTRRNVRFTYQDKSFGGRSELGGLVTDFVLDMGGYALAVMVNGDYWHTLPEQVLRDIETRERLPGQYFEGLIIMQVLTIWESTLLSCNREHAVDLLLTGVEVGRTA